MSQALRKLSGAINKSKTVVIFINQLREKVGVLFGNPETTAGGRALKYYASVRLDIRKTNVIKEGGAAIGNRAKVKVVKNKVAPPFREAEFDIIYGQGISKTGCIIDIAENLGIVDKSGAWYSYNGEKIGQGRENTKKYLDENPEICEAIEKKVRDNFDEAFEQSLGEEEDDEEQDIMPDDDDFEVELTDEGKEKLNEE
jgi:recombination protein RecA